MARVAHHDEAAATEIRIDRQGRLVIPRQLRAALGDVPGVVRARQVDDGVLLEHPSAGHVEVAEDGLPILRGSGAVGNDEVLAAIGAERADR